MPGAATYVAAFFSEVGGKLAGKPPILNFDKVNEVLRINAGIVDEPPTMVAGIDTDYVEGVGKLDDRLLILLDLVKLFGDVDLGAAGEQAAASAA